MNGNLAIKVNYNNGNNNFQFIGYRGTCSEDIIKYNVENKKTWCSDKRCPCFIYHKKGFKGNKPAGGHCTESTLLSKWEFNAGSYLKGSREGEPLTITRVEVGDIAILTTRFPNEEEEKRKIFGIFRIGKISKNLNNIYADPKYKIAIPPEEVDDLLFWNYYKTLGGSVWGSGLFRYLDDSQITNILIDLAKTIVHEQTSQKLFKLLYDKYNISKQEVLKWNVDYSGSLKRKNQRKDEVLKKRKYGKGGEGENHKKLKDFIFKNPETIGLKNIKHSKLEYSFLSGDTVDILFELENGKDVVVEIETDIVLPGCHQAIKYRALRCAEKNLELNSKNIEAVVVAWQFNEEEIEFMEKYGIKYFNVKL